MYKSHFTTWGLRKNNRVVEAQEILRAKSLLASQGMSSLFIVRGRLADIEDLERCCRRAKALPTEFDENDIAILPTGIECVIFRDGITSISSPENFKQLQCLLHYTAVHVDSCFDRGLWSSGSDDEELVQYYSARDKEILRLCLESIYNAGVCFKSGQAQLGGAHARLALEHLPNLLRRNHQGSMGNLLLELQRLQERGPSRLPPRRCSMSFGACSTDCSLQLIHTKCFLRP